MSWDYGVTAQDTNIVSATRRLLGKAGPVDAIVGMSAMFVRAFLFNVHILERDLEDRQETARFRLGKPCL